MGDSRRIALARGQKSQKLWEKIESFQCAIGEHQSVYLVVFARALARLNGFSALACALALGTVMALIGTGLTNQALACDRVEATQPPWHYC